MTDYVDRSYRGTTGGGAYAGFELSVFETDLMIYVDKALKKDLRDLKTRTTAYTAALRRELEAYIAQYPEFATTLTPWPDPKAKSSVVRAMIMAGAKAGVGPMAAVAGAIAEFSARYLHKFSRAVIVENGGDIFVSAPQETVVGVFAGASPLSMRLGLVVPPDTPLGICTSSGTVGPSFSMGRADAVCVAAKDAALADALATALGNMVKSEADFETVMATARGYKEILHVLLIYGTKSAIWGGLEIRPL